jgi:hypothetical protein
MQNDNLKINSHPTVTANRRTLFSFYFVVFTFSLFLLSLPAADAAVIIQRPVYVGLTEGLVGFWSFDGQDTSYTAGQKIIANDTSGNNNHGQNQGTAVPIPVQGKLGQALQFDGVDDYVDMEDSYQFILQNTPFTFSAWVYLDRFLTASDEYPTAVILRTDAGVGYTFFFSNNGSYLGFNIGAQSTFSRLRTATPTADFVGRWIHLTVQYNGNGAGTDSNYTVYMNNVKQSLVASGGYGTGTNETAIGGFFVDFQENEAWFGKIDDVRIYNRALSPQEIKRLYNLGR